MVDGTAARNAPGQDDALFFQEFEVDLGVGALVQADDDGRPVLPEVEDRFLRPEGFQAEFIECHVQVRVGGSMGKPVHTGLFRNEDTSYFRILERVEKVFHFHWLIIKLLNKCKLIWKFPCFL